MRTFIQVGLVAFALPLFNVICKADGPDSARTGDLPKPSPGVLADNSDEEATIAANLAKLGPDDRKLAEAQKFCPVMTANRLGGMGVPTKVMVKGQPVFVCCKGCRRKALANPDATLAKVEELKKKNGGAGDK